MRRDLGLRSGLHEPRTGAAVVALLVAALLAATLSEWRSATATNGVAFANDFAPMYCAGAIRDRGGNPYLYAEQSVCGGRTDRFIPHSGLDEPAPIPGYGVALFGLLAFLPYVVAAALWIVLSLAALLVGAWAVSNMSGLSLPAVFAAFAVIGGLTDLAYGQLPPIAVGTIAAGAYLASHERPRTAAIVCSCAMLEPHLGVPALIGMVVWFPRTRVPVAAIAIVLGIISAVTIGIAGNVEYFAHVLPLQTAAEADSNIQYSLTWLLHWFGIGDAVASRIGSLDYAVSVLIGVVIARRVAVAARCEGLAVLVPPAFALLGGPYIHIFQMLAALPAALVLATHAPRGRALAWTAVFLLALTWPWILTRALTALPIVVLVFLSTAAFEGASTRVRGIAAVATIAMFVAINVALAITPTRVVVHADSARAFRERIGPLARYSSGVAGINDRERRAPVANASYRTVAQKIPTWTGLILLMGLCLTLAASSASRAAPTPVNVGAANT